MGYMDVGNKIGTVRLDSLFAIQKLREDITHWHQIIDWS
jgi:hypothetical protein